jgi:hypothetical protein
VEDVEEGDEDGATGVVEVWLEDKGVLLADADPGRH